MCCCSFQIELDLVLLVIGTMTNLSGGSCDEVTFVLRQETHSSRSTVDFVTSFYILKWWYDRCHGNDHKLPLLTVAALFKKIYLLVIRRKLLLGVPGLPVSPVCLEVRATWATGRPGDRATGRPGRPGDPGAYLGDQATGRLGDLGAHLGDRATSESINSGRLDVQGSGSSSRSRTRREQIVTSIYLSEWKEEGRDQQWDQWGLFSRA